MSSLTYLTVLSLGSVSGSLGHLATLSTLRGATPTSRPSRPSHCRAVLVCGQRRARQRWVPPLSWNATVAQWVKMHVSWLRNTAT
ncbi:unnamed protein product [Urochloa humidicola]